MYGSYIFVKIFSRNDFTKKIFQTSLILFKLPNAVLLGNFELKIGNLPLINRFRRYSNNAIKTKWNRIPIYACCAHIAIHTCV